MDQDDLSSIRFDDYQGAVIVKRRFIVVHLCNIGGWCINDPCSSKLIRGSANVSEKIISSVVARSHVSEPRISDLCSSRSRRRQSLNGEYGGRYEWSELHFDVQR